jgi:outer membrane protein OmpA-like peptidoglycan-associated protein
MKQIILIYLVCSCNAGLAQRIVLLSPEKQFLAKGKEFYLKGNYEEAIAALKNALAKDSVNIEANFYLGMSYLQTGKDEQAIPYLTYYTDHYDAAKSSVMEKHKAIYRLYYIREQKKLLQSPSLVMAEPVKLAGNVNSPFPDYAPVMDATGTRLYFTSRRAGGISPEAIGVKEGDEDAYFTEKRGGVWSDAKLLPPPINTALNEGIATFSADGQFMMMVACNRGDGVGSCDLYYSELNGDQWSELQNMGEIVNSPAWDSQPTLSYDGKRFIFISDRTGGYGDVDIYMVEKNQFGDWGPAMNLGPMVNTPFTEHSPFFSQDGKTLYFSSNGHPGYGDFDIFKTVKENGQWSIPINMGRPLNTPNDDRFFTIGGSGEKGYFSSDRTGDSELYEIDIPESMRPEPTIVVSGTVTSIKDGKKVSAYILVEDLNTGELIAANKSNSTTGHYLVVLPSGRHYSVSANKEGYFFYSQSFEVSRATRFQEIRKDIQLNPIEKGAKVVLNNIFFETGKATLTPESRLELEKAIELMRTNPTMVVEIGGHTDNVGDDNYNMKLSHDRARSVRDYLVNAGIASERVQAKGYGEQNPVATNETEDGRKANRRTEFVILEF